MKKLIILISSLVMIFLVHMSASAIDIVIDGETLESEDAPVNVDERVLVPMRAVFEALDASVSWDDSEKTVWAQREGQFVSVNTITGVLNDGIINSEGGAYWSDNIRLDVPARIINDRVYVPVRAVSESLGAFVTWDGANERVIIDNRLDLAGKIYYASDSDYQKLYCVKKNGRGRHKVSDRSIKDPEIYDGKVYYLDRDRGYLCRADENGEEVLLVKTIYKLGIDEGWVYYQELDGGGAKSGILYRISTETGEIQQLTDVHVKYAEKYKDYIYFNTDYDNVLHAVLKDGSATYVIDTGDSLYSKLYPFNCVFYGDFILIEDGVWYGNLMRCRLDGSDMKPLTVGNAMVEKNQQYNRWVVYKQPSKGPDIYYVNLDGSGEKLVHKSDSSWIDIMLLAQIDDVVYYKHPMRNEVYRTNMDGTIDEYVCYADSLQAVGENIFTSYHGLYKGNLDGSGLQQLYSRDVKGFAIIDQSIYAKDANSGRMFLTDFNGRGGYVTADACGEWAQTDE